ncbi:unnamed protein product [Linum tenue]|uniref:Transmembrane protein n=2 Tax=Linum tenue TaxID=586396 RepID=A0AAV0KZ29_9ROSI|nr:unnamed protein product [Linum tenue]
MESSWLKGLLTISTETIKIIPKNPTLITQVTILILVFNSSIYFVSLGFLRLLINSFQSLAIDPTNIDRIGKSLASIIVYELIVAVIVSLSSLFVAASAILVSAMALGGKQPTTTVKGLFFRVIRAWKGPLVTWAYTTLFLLGFMCVLFLIAYPFTLVFLSSLRILSITMNMFAVLGSVLYSYLLVDLSLGMVGSVVEREICGLEVIGKAARIGKGMELHGFVVNLLFGLVGWGLLKCLVWVGFRLPGVGQMASPVGLAGLGWPTSGQIFLGLVVVNLFCLLKILWWMAYCVMFYEGMKRHGEEVVELVEDLDYTKVPSVNMV